MKYILRKTELLIIVSMTLLSPVSWSQQNTESPPRKALHDCAKISAGDARLACFDKLAREVGNLASPREIDGPFVDVAGSESETLSGVKKKNGKWLGIEPYRSSYILPITHNYDVNQRLYSSLGEQFESDETEVKFQFSFQLPVWEKFLQNDIDLYFAYTQLSFFQAFNSKYSEPFRESVYEPELGFRWQPDLTFSGWQLESLRLAYNHQSNGRSEPLSRSWDRTLAQLVIKKDNLSLGIRLWHRIDNVPVDDDNPDIEDFIGHGEMFADYDFERNHFGLMIRNPFENEAIQFDWTYQFSDQVGLYFQYFNGFGESMLDYNHRVNRIGVGFMLNEWF